MSFIVKVGKTAKKYLKGILIKEVPNHTGLRRLETVKTTERVVAMTFDDGPMALPASPDDFGGKALTEILLDTLREFGAYGTFDVVGDTSENYPDQPGKNGSALWGGVRYDHYPDIFKDEFGGAKNQPALIRRILDEGHQITNHGYRHVLFGKKPFVYGKRAYLESLDEVLEDLQRLHNYMVENFGYTMTMARPPHYVDNIQGGFSAYDAYQKMGYQYLAAPFDGAGWLPLKTYEEEVRATYEPMQKALEANPDALCGQIIFQKDGYNMGRRTPVAHGLRKQLELLTIYGYKVVTVEELLKHEVQHETATELLAESH